MVRTRFFWLALLLGAVAPPAGAQDLVWRAEGVGGAVGRGADLHRLGDYNADGWDDLLERGEAWSANARTMAIRIASGRDGSILSSGMPLPHAYWLFGNIAPLGDMDGDGRPDYGGHAYDGLMPWATQTLVVVSSATHQILWSATIPNAWGTGFGAVLCGDLDVDNDGHNDVVTSAFTLTPGGTIFVYDHTGTEKYRLVDPVPNVHVGLDVASLQGDLDGDGCDDFVSTGLEPQDRGAIVCFSGRTGAVLRVSYGEQPGDKLVNAGACGDIDRDGVPDYCAGGSFGRGVVTAFSGATGQVIHSWRDTQHCCMGINVTGGQDLDSDGVPDLITGQMTTSLQPNDRIVSALSGRDGTFLARWYSSGGVFTCMAESVAMLRPPPGEHYAIAVYAERCWSTPTNGCTNNLCPGLVLAYTCAPPGVREYGLPDASPGRPLAQSGMRALTRTSPQRVRFTMAEAAPGAAALLMLGTSDAALQGSALPMMLDPWGLSGITLWQSADVVLFTTAGTSGPARGYAALELTMPTGRTIAASGTRLHAQWLWFDPASPGHGSTAGQRFLLQ